MMRQPLLVGHAISCAMVFASCDSILAQTQLSKSTKAAHEVFLEGYARANNNCEAIDPPKINVDQPPEHGIVCLRRGGCGCERLL